MFPGCAPECLRRLPSTRFPTRVRWQSLLPTRSLPRARLLVGECQRLADAGRARAVVARAHLAAGGNGRLEVSAPATRPRPCRCRIAAAGWGDRTATSKSRWSRAERPRDTPAAPCRSARAVALLRSADRLR